MRMRTAGTGSPSLVIQENVRDRHGRPLIGDGTPLHVDDFGNEYHEGAGRYLTTLITSHLNVRVRYDRPGTIQRSMAELVSPVDAREAEEVGRAAVRHALDGETNHMVSISPCWERTVCHYDRADSSRTGGGRT